MSGKYWNIIVMMLWLNACTTPSNKESTQAFTIIIDDLGRTVKLKKNANRFLPFAPSITEIAYLICDTNEIVGRTPYCNYPTESKDKQVVDNYPPNLEQILLLKPDLLITKDGMLSLAQAKSIEDIGIPVYFQQYDNVNDILKGINNFALLTNHKEKGISVHDSLANLLNQLERTRPNLNDNSVLLLVSDESLYAYGKNSYASDILKRAGGKNIIDTLFHEVYPLLNVEYILKLNPEYIICGKQGNKQLDFFERYPALKRTSAYKKQQFFMVNDDYIARPGPRVVLAIDTIRKILVN